MEKRFGDIAEFINGRAFKPNEWGTKGLPIIRIQNLTGSSEVFNYYEGEFDKRYLVKKDDILISWSASLGVYRWKNDDAVLNQHIFKVNLKNGIDKTFFYYAVQEKLIEMERQVHGSTMKHITKDKFDNIKIPLPDLKTQQKIAYILEQADVARQKRKEASQLTEQFLQSAFLEMFGDPVRNEMGWEIEPLEYFGKWKSGGTPSRSNNDFFNGNIPWYTSGELNQMYVIESIEHISEKAINESAAKLIEPNTLLLGMYDTAALKSSITTIPCSCNQAIAYSKLENKKVNIIYLYFTIQVGREFFRSQQRGVRQKNLNLDMIKNLVVPLPPLSLQQKFASLVEQVEQLRAKQRESEKELENLFQSLMQRYFG